MTTNEKQQERDHKQHEKENKKQQVIENIEETQEETSKFSWKEFGLRLLFPKAIWIFLLVNISAISLIYVFLNGMGKHFIAYIVYVASAYALTVVCARIPSIVRKIDKMLHNNKYTHRYLTDTELRLQFSMYRGLIINIPFALFKIIMGFVYNSAWLFAVAGYNTLLTVMRFIVVFRDRKKGISEEERQKRGLLSYHVCGWLMLVLNIAISVIVFMVVVKKQTIVYHEIVVIALAAYTFYCFTRAIINLIKYRRKSPVHATIKHIEMAKAIVSIFTMQVAMLTRYGGQDKLDSGLMNTLTGTAVVIAINTMAALMLARIRDVNKERKSIEQS